MKVGDALPNFTSKDTNGNDFDSRSIIGKQAVVIYFYPKDETRVCTEQACSFRDNYEEFKALGADVIGISADSVASEREPRRSNARTRASNSPTENGLVR